MQNPAALSRCKRSSCTPASVHSLSMPVPGVRTCACVRMMCMCVRGGARTLLTCSMYRNGKGGKFSVAGSFQYVLSGRCREDGVSRTRRKARVHCLYLLQLVGRRRRGKDLVALPLRASANTENIWHSLTEVLKLPVKARVSCQVRLRYCHSLLCWYAVCSGVVSGCRRFQQFALSHPSHTHC